IGRFKVYFSLLVWNILDPLDDSITDAAACNRLLYLVPVILGSLRLSCDNKTVILVILQHLGESGDQILESFIRRNVSKEQQGPIAFADSQLSLCLGA